MVIHFERLMPTWIDRTHSEDFVEGFYFVVTIFWGFFRILWMMEMQLISYQEASFLYLTKTILTDIQMLLKL